MRFSESTWLPALFGGLAAVAVLWGTRYGPLVFPDTMSYLYAAQSLTDRGDLRVPLAEWSDPDSTSALVHFPPGYPLALAAVHWTGISMLSGVRVIGALAALITVASLAGIAGAEGGAGAAVVMVLTLTAIEGLVEAQLSALSEPLFFAALASTLALMVGSPGRPWAYGVTAAIGSMVRYAGVSLVAAAAVWAVLSDGTPRSRPVSGWLANRVRVVRAALFAGLPGVLCHVAWQMHAWLVGATTPASTFSMKGDLTTTFAQGRGELIRQLMPLDLPWTWRRALAMLVAIGAITLLVVGWRFSGGATRAWTGRLEAAGLLTAASYTAVVLYSRLFVDQGIPFDDRILGPLLTSAGVAVAAAALATWPRLQGARLAVARYGAALLGVLWLAGGAVRSLRGAAWTLADRADYHSERWQQTPTAAWLRAAGRQYALFTNDPAAVFFTAGRPSRLLPGTLAPDSVRAFGELLGRVHGALLEYPIPFAPMADASRLAAALGLYPAITSAGGTAWVRPTDMVPQRGPEPPRCDSMPPAAVGREAPAGPL